MPPGHLVQFQHPALPAPQTDHGRAVPITRRNYEDSLSFALVIFLSLLTDNGPAHLLSLYPGLAPRRYQRRTRE